MSNSIKQVFGDLSTHLKIDKNLVKEIHLYAVNFVNKNPDHIAFFGGNLLGVHVIRFKDEDTDHWFDDVLDIDMYRLKDELHALPKINADFKVASDVFYISCVALCNKIFNSTSLSQSEKEQGMVEALMIMQYKMITSRMSHIFPYPADPGVAAATYNALSKKFSLKIYGTWNKLLEARARDTIDEKSIHYRTLKNLDDDAGVLYLITDMKTRINDIIKVMRGVFETIRQTKGKFTSTNNIGIDQDGEAFIKDKSRLYPTYIRYINETISDETSFIKLELIEIIGKAMHTMPEKFLQDTLTYMTDHYRYRDDKLIEEIINDTLIYTFDYITNNKTLNINTTDLAELITKMRAVYMSSRSTDPQLLKIRKNIESVVSKSIRSRNPSIIASVRTGVMLYIVLRALTMKHYSK